MPKGKKGAGDPADGPPPLEGPPGLAQVDVDVALPEPYVPDFSGRDDDYRCFILDPELSGEEHITAVEYAPDRAEMVHHMVLHRASRSAALDKDAADEGPGWKCFGGPGVSSNRIPGDLDLADTLGAWAPGVNVSRYPEGTGVPIDDSEVVVVQTERVGVIGSDAVVLHHHLQTERGVAAEAKTIRGLEGGSAEPLIAAWA